MSEKVRESVEKIKKLAREKGFDFVADFYSQEFDNCCELKFSLECFGDCGDCDQSPKNKEEVDEKATQGSSAHGSS